MDDVTFPSADTCCVKKALLQIPLKLLQNKTKRVFLNILGRSLLKAFCLIVFFVCLKFEFKNKLSVKLYRENIVRIQNNKPIRQLIQPLTNSNAIL